MVQVWSRESGFGRRPTHRLFLSVLAALIGFGISFGIGEPAHAADQTLKATSTTGNQITLGQPVLLSIEAQSETLIRGTITIGSDNSPPMVYAIEVPAGTTKELKVVGPALAWAGDGYSISWYDENGKRLATDSLRTTTRSGDTIVGVFPSLGTDFPERLRQPTDTDSFLFPISTDQFAIPAAAFTQYDVITAKVDDLRRLEGDTLTAFKLWLADGGRVVVDDASIDEINTVLATDRTDGHYGKGSIEASDGDLRAGRWDQATRPIPARSMAAIGPLAWMGNGGMIGFENPSQGLIKYTGQNLIGSLALLGIVFIYAILVGPIAFAVFRRRRSLLWVVGPLVAVLACGLVWLDGNRRRNGIEGAHGTVITVDDVASRSATIEMLYSPRNGTASLTLPPLFSLTPSISESWAPMSVQLTPQGTTLSKSTEAGSFSLYTGSGPALAFNGQLSGTAVVNGDEVSGTIVNRLDVDLHQVAVMWNGKALNIGDVGAGQTVDYTLTDKNRVQELVAVTVWPDAFRGWWGPVGGSNKDHPRADLVSPTVWDQLAIVNSNIGFTDNVDVAGWTDELASPVTTATKGVDLVATTITPETPSTLGDSNIVFAAESNSANGWTADSLLRLDRPDADGPLSLQVPRVFGNVKLLIDDSWVAIKVPANKVVEIPDSALDDSGGLYVSSEINLELFQGGPEANLQAGTPRLSVATPDGSTVSLESVTVTGSGQDSSEAGDDPGETTTTVGGAGG